MNAYIVYTVCTPRFKVLPPPLYNILLLIPVTSDTLFALISYLFNIKMQNPTHICWQLSQESVKAPILTWMRNHNAPEWYRCEYCFEGDFRRFRRVVYNCNNWFFIIVTNFWAIQFTDYAVRSRHSTIQRWQNRQFSKTNFNQIPLFFWNERMSERQKKLILKFLKMLRQLYENLYR